MNPKAGRPGSSGSGGSGGPGGPPARPAPPTGWKLWLAGARPRTLPAAVVPVLVGTAVAAGVIGGKIVLTPGADVAFTTVSSGLKGLDLYRFAAALVVALFLQIGTNFANDYSDGIKGTDNETRVGPIRLVGSGLTSPGSVKKAAYLSFAVAAVAGLYLAYAASWWLLLVGLLSFAAGWFYTGGPKPYGYYGFGELFVFVFFGLVATVGSAFVQIHGRYTVPKELLVAPDLPAYAPPMPWIVWPCAVAVGCLATALLVINNLRDIPTDTVAGKKTLAVRIGDKATRWLYFALLLIPILLIPIIAGLGQRPWAVLAFVTIFVAQKPLLPVLSGAKGPALIPVLGGTGRTQLVYGVLLAVGLFISA